MRRRVARVVSVAFAAPLLRRLGFHINRLTHNVDRTFFLRLFLGLFGIVLVAALLVTFIEGPRDGIGEFFSTLSSSFYWGVTTVMGSGDASYVHTPGGFVISWLLVLFGVAIVASITVTSSAATSTMPNRPANSRRKKLRSMLWVSRLMWKPRRRRSGPANATLTTRATRRRMTPPRKRKPEIPVPETDAPAWG